MKIVPEQLVVAARGIISLQGGDPTAIANDGTLDLAKLLPLVVDQVEVRTNMGNVRFGLKPGPSDPTMNALIRQVNPEIILSGPGGRATLKPQVDPNAPPPDWSWILAWAGVAGAILLVARRLK